MAWTAANPVSVGDPTKKSHYDTVWDNAFFGRANDGSWLNTSLKIQDTNESHGLTIQWSENDSENRTLDIKVNEGNRTLNFAENLTIGDGGNVTIIASGGARAITLTGSPTLGDWFDQNM